MFRKFFSLMFLVSVIFFSGQAIDTPRIEALNYGNDGSRYEVINDYYVFSENGIEYYVIYVVYAPYSDFFRVYLKDVKNGEQINHSEYYFNGGNVYELISNTLGNEKGYVSSNSRARTIYNPVVSGKLKKAEKITVWEIYDKANKLFKSGAYKEAIVHYEKFLEQFINYEKTDNQLAELAGKAYSEVGICYVGINNYDKAKECYDKAKRIELKSNDIEGYYYYGFLCEKLELYEEALYGYNMALILNSKYLHPDNRSLEKNSLAAKVKIDKLKETNKDRIVKNYNEVSEFDLNTNKKIEEADAKFKAKDYEGAKGILNEILNETPNAKIYLMLAKVHMKEKNKDYNLIINLVSKAIKLDPHNPDYYDYMARVYNRLSWRAIGSRGTSYEIYFRAKRSCGGPPEIFYANRANELRYLRSS